MFCTNDNGLLPEWQERLIELGGFKKWVKIDSGHTPFLSCTELLTQVTRAAAGEEIVLKEDYGVKHEDVSSGMTNLRVEAA